MKVDVQTILNLLHAEKLKSHQNRDRALAAGDTGNADLHRNVALGIQHAIGTIQFKYGVKRRAAKS